MVALRVGRGAVTINIGMPGAGSPSRKGLGFIGTIYRPVLWGFAVLLVLVVPLVWMTTRSRRTLVYNSDAARMATPYASAMGKYDCIPADVMLGGGLGPTGNGSSKMPNLFKPVRMPSVTGDRPVPLVATNLDHDTEKYLTRFIRGLEHPISHKLVVWGGCDPMVADQVEHILSAYPEVQVYRARMTLGCASGWNVILRYMSMHDDVPWAIIFNSDMYTPPGSLKAFAHEIWAAVDADPKLCLGFFTTQGAGSLGRYTAYVYTRHALNTLGYFDANIYPAYYEDIEYDIRFKRAVDLGICSPVRTFNASIFEHGYRSKKYLSGSKVVQQVMASYGDEYFKRVAKEWKEKINRGKLSSPLYLADKWGCRAEEHITVEDCRYARPFNDPENPLSYWVLDAERRKCLDSSTEMAPCPYTLAGGALQKKGTKQQQQQQLETRLLGFPGGNR